MTTIRQRAEKLAKDLRENRARVEGGYAVDFSSIELIESFARSERVLARNEALEEAAKVVLGGHRRDTDVAMIRALKTDAAKGD